MTPRFRGFLKPWAMLSALILFAVCFFYVDRAAAYFFHEHAQALHPLQVLEVLGKGFIYITLFAMLAGVFWVIYPHAIWRGKCVFLCLSVLIPYAMTGILKVLLGRARPELWFSDHAFGFFGFQKTDLYWSFPSGHTTTLIALALGLTVVFPRYRVYWISLGVCLSLTRVLLTFHYLSDVLGTVYLVGIEFALMMIYLQGCNKEKA